jgi:glycosyltransferase involved in cell wall biosynthesis
VPVSTAAISPDLPAGGSQTITRAGNHPYENLSSEVEPAFNFVCLNGDQLDRFIAAGGGTLLGGRPTIGHWAWETDVLPPGWMPAFRHLDEVWVISNFIAENLARVSPVPVIVVPPAVTVPDLAGVELELGWDERFMFVFMLDFFSTLRRKNALGLIDAFTRAFAPGEGPRLIVKTMNAEFRPRDADELRSRIGDRSDIEVIDRYLEPLQKYALLARADCYVSLHRSEGLGLTLAEAMALGTPVIATGYSGNTDFMSPENSYLVDWTPTRVGVGSEIYPERGVWAEPDLDHAAELMRRVWTQPEEAARKVERARADIERLYAPEVAGAIARGRLERLADNRLRSAPGADGSAASRTIRHVLALDPRVGAPPFKGGIGGRIRRLVLRLIYPFTFHERQLDRAMFDELEHLRGRIEELDEQRRHELARARRARS